MLISKLRLACAAVTLAALPMTIGFAQAPRDQRTYFTFSQAVELPGGTTLQAGTYVFRLLDSPSNRHVVQVMSEDQSKLHTTLLAIPAQRMEPPDEPEVRFMEAPADQPSAIQTWWYPGRTIGHEFIYPREQAMQVAKRTNSSVLTTDESAVWGDGLPEDAKLARVSPDGRETAVTDQASQTPTEMRGQAVSGRAEAPASANAQNTTASSTTQPSTTEPSASQPSTAQTATNEPPTAQTPAPEGGTAAAGRTAESQPEARERQTTATSEDRQERAQTGTTSTADDRAAARTALPATASPMPLVGLIGLASLAAAGLLRRARK